MPQLWQCDVCGTRYRVNWLSHCYRCEGAPPKAKPKAAPEKPSRRKRMPRIVAGVGASNARADQEPTEDAPSVEVVGEGGTEFLTFVSPEPVGAPVEPEPVPPVVEDAPAPTVAPAPVQDAPVAAPKDGAA